MRAHAQQAAGHDTATHDVAGRIRSPLHAPVPVTPVFAPTLQRTPGCACGGGCPRCRAAGGSSRYTINTPGDRYEREADRVAAQVMRMSDPTGAPAVASASGPATIQRACASCEAASNDEGEIRAKEEHGRTPRVTAGAEGRIDALRGGGEPLSSTVRSYFEPRFGRELGAVRVHTDARAAESAREVGALAYTVGRDIVFGAGQFAPDTPRGGHLLAHELTHTIQQTGAGTPVLRKEAPTIDAHSGPRIARQNDLDAGVPPAAGVPSDDTLDGGLPPGGTSEPQPVPDAGPQQQPQQPPQQQPQQPPQQVLTQQPLPGLGWTQCATYRAGTGTMRTNGFNGTTSGTYISNIQVNIQPSTTSTLTLTWQNASLSTTPTPIPTTLDFSPGAGNCNTDCSNACNSQQDGSHCTPLSPPTYHVQGYSCHLSTDAKAKCVTWFHRDRGVAFHYYNVPTHAASHGCVRMQASQRGAEWIFDNTLAGITTVNVSRNPADGPGPKCYRRGVLVDRPASAPTGPVGPCAPPPRRSRGRH
jgi:hypothetical protein